MPSRFAAYGEAAAFFVSTGVNALYILYGGLLLYPRMLLTNKVTPAMRRLPKVNHASGRRVSLFSHRQLVSRPLSPFFEQTICFRS